MPNVHLQPEAVAMWRRLNRAAHDAEMLVARAALDQVRCSGSATPEGLLQLALDLRILANEQRERVLREP